MTREPGAPRWVGVLAVLLVCAAVYWPLLGARPFASSEGHRVVPAWTMLRSGEFWRLEMFGQTYLRKPPGMPWAIAGASSLLGETEFAARSVSALSATAMALAAYLFATRWFGRPYGLAAGLAQALMPLFWAPGRSAEIESLNNLGTQLACLALVELLVGPRPRDRSSPLSAGADEGLRIPTQAMGPVEEAGVRPPRRLSNIICAAVGAIGLCIAGIAKGPASALVVAGVIAGACLAARSARPLARVWMWAAFIAAGAVLIPVGLRVLSANDAADAIRQSTGDFRWTRSVLEIAALPLMAFVAALPASLALLFPWGPDARREAEADRSTHGSRAYAVARTLAFGWAAGAGLSVLAGLGNHRYLMPAAALLPPLVAYVARGVWRFDPPFTPSRRGIARAMTFRNPLAWPVLLTVAAVLGAVWSARARDQATGRDAGRLIAGVVSADGGAVVWADDLIEARPDALLYAERAGGVRPEWRKREMLAGERPPVGAYVILRTDAGSTEFSRYAAVLERGGLVPVGVGAVGPYTFAVCLSVPSPG